MRNHRLFALFTVPLLGACALVALACGGSPKLPAGPGPEYEEPAASASAPTVSPSAGGAAGAEGNSSGSLAPSGAGNAPASANGKPPTPDEVALIAKRAGEAQPKFVGCYDAELRAKRKAEGKMLLRFVVASDGAVKDAGPEGETAMGPELVACIVSTIKAVKFEPRATGDATVMLPLTFVHAAAKTEDAGAGDASPADAAPTGKKKKK